MYLPPNQMYHPPNQMYHPPNQMYHPPKSGYDALTNLRMRLTKIAFVLKRIVPQGEQGIFRKRCTAL